jgi:hypothetical protein
MPDYTQTLVSALELEALHNLDRIIRVAMVVPNTSGFLVSAIQALDQVRIDQGLPIPDPVQAPPAPPENHNAGQVSALAGALIKRDMDGPKS